MGNQAYFAPLVTLPVIITEPGDYITRDGDTVTVTHVSTAHSFHCVGRYGAGRGPTECWHKSGRLYAHNETQNDIVRKA